MKHLREPINPGEAFISIRTTAGDEIETLDLREYDLRSDSGVKLLMSDILFALRFVGIIPPKLPGAG